MIYALCFATNTVHCFLSERQAAEHCRQAGGEWQLCDEAGRPIHAEGCAPQQRTGLLAAHLWLCDAHEPGGVLYQGYDPALGLFGHV